MHHGAALAQLLAQALAHQLRWRHAPACLRVGAQLLGVAVTQAVKHGSAIQCCGRLHLCQHKRWQRCHAVAGGFDNGARTKVIHHGAWLGLQRRTCSQTKDYQAK
jgi:hypothetical protein